MHRSSKKGVESPREGWDPAFVHLDTADNDDNEVEDWLSCFTSEPPRDAGHATLPSRDIVQPAPEIVQPAYEIAQPRAYLGAVAAAAVRPLARVSLAEILASDMPLPWFEVIAIAQAVCQAMLEAPGTTEDKAPPLWHFALTSLGTVEISAGIAADGSPTALVWRILNAGPAGTMPVWCRGGLFLLRPWLRIATLQGLFTALEYVERPGRSGLIRAVVDRYLARRAPAVRAAPAETGLRPGQPKMTVDEGLVPIAGRTRPGLAAAVAVSAIVVSLSFDAWLLIRAAASNRADIAAKQASVAPAAPDSTPMGTPGALMRRLGLAAPVPRQSPDGRPMIFDAARTATGVVPRRPERHKASLRGGHIAETPAPDRQVMASNAPSAVRATHEVQADTLRFALVDVVDVLDLRAAPARPHAEPATIEADDGIYDSRDLDVTPPAELAPYRPIAIMRPSSSPETVTFELVIDAKGLVQSVELLQPVRRWDDVMLVSVMKARRFRPATRNNHPVRYRTRILVGASPDR